MLSIGQVDPTCNCGSTAAGASVADDPAEAVQIAPATLPQLKQPVAWFDIAGGPLGANEYAAPAVVDWDGDGLADLLVGEKTPDGRGQIRFYRNAGTSADPAFEPASLLLAGAEVLSLPAEGCLGVSARAGDLDGDGRLDLILGLADGRLLWARNVATEGSGLPVLDSPQDLLAGPAGAKEAVDVGKRAMPELADWNNDGAVDLLVGALDGTIRLLLNQSAAGQPDFLAPSALSVGGRILSVAGGRSSPSVVDFDGDGRKDLITGNTEGELYLYANLGTDAAPELAAPVRLAVNGIAVDLPGESRSRLAVGDLTGDGVAEVVVGAKDGLLRIYELDAPARSTALPLSLVDSQGRPVELRFDDNTVLVGAASWCGACAYFKQAVSAPENVQRLAGLRIVFAFGDEGLGVGRVAKPEYLEALPGEVVFLAADSQAKPTAFPTVYDPVLGRFVEKTAFEWVSEWLSRQETPAQPVSANAVVSSLPGVVQSDASALSLTDAEGRPVELRFDDNTVLVGAASWCGACAYFKQAVSAPENVQQLAGLRIVFAFGDEGLGVGRVAKPEYLEALPGEVVFLAAGSQAKPIAFPTVYDPALGRFTEKTAFEWVGEWLSRQDSPTPSASTQPAVEGPATTAAPPEAPPSGAAAVENLASAATLVPDPVYAGETALLIEGTAGPDSIRIRTGRRPNEIVVRVNGATLGIFQPTSRIMIYGFEGDDRIHVHSRVRLPSWLFGGPGQDVLIGGSGDDVLLGEDDDDRLHGRAGRDLIIGGWGSDELFGDLDDDILVAGTTDYDSHAAALADILALWNSPGSYPNRIEQLAGEFLNPTTVHGDTSPDDLNGQAGRDWYFANYTSPDAATRDRIRDLARNEQAVVTQSSLGPFSILGPAGLISDSTPTVTWQTSAGAAVYDLQISSDPGAAAVVQTYSDLTGTAFTLPAPLADGTYYLHLTARDLAGNTTVASNNAFTFTVDATAPAPFAILAPTGLTNNVAPEAIWEVAAGADSYDLAISAQADCSAPVQQYSGLTGVNQVLTTLADGIYYTCVTAKDTAGNMTIASNNGLSFTVDATAPAPFAILSPTGTIDTQEPMITWESAAGAASYDLIIAENADCSSPVQQIAGIAATSFQASLGADGTFYTCVSAADLAGNSVAATNNGLAFTVVTVIPMHHLMFATSTLHQISGNTAVPPPFYPAFGGFAAADWSCTYAAYSAGLLTSWDGLTPVWKALLSSNGMSAKERIVIEGKVYNMDGQILANDAMDMWDSSTLPNPVGFDEYGNQITTNKAVWTGALPGWDWQGNSCGEWDTGMLSSMMGDVSATDGRWTTDVTEPCSTSARLYCISPAMN